MYFAGIIAEYDPFHNGHAWQLAAARAHGAKYVAVALSCGLTQRGALPLLPESVRVAAALASGADSGICPSRPLCLRRGRSLCPGRGSAAVRRRVRRAGFWGRDPGPCPADPDRTAAADPGLPHRPARRLSKRRPQLCCGTAGSRTVPLLRQRRCRLAGQAQQ